MFFAFVFWVICTVGISVWASRWNRSGIAWFFVSFFLSPVLAGLILLIAGNNGKNCPKCAEMIKHEATICKHCKYNFSTENVNVKSDI